jgi:hypothetical protein
MPCSSATLRDSIPSRIRIADGSHKRHRHIRRDDAGGVHLRLVERLLVLPSRSEPLHIEHRDDAGRLGLAIAIVAPLVRPDRTVMATSRRPSHLLAAVPTSTRPQSGARRLTPGAAATACGQLGLRTLVVAPIDAALTRR